MELVASDIELSHPGAAILARRASPTEADVRTLLFDGPPIRHGTHFTLLESPAGELEAICTAATTDAAPAEFMLCVDGEILAADVSRERALDFFVAGLAAIPR